MKSRRANRTAIGQRLYRNSATGAILIIPDYSIIFLTTLRASYKLQNFKRNSYNQSGLPGEHKGLPVVSIELC
jgi:hypothetical protein